jgi:hypothetical protein
MNSGIVERAEFSESFPRDSLHVTISQEKALEIATGYAIAHYPNFTEKKMRLSDATLLDHNISKEYRFVWQQKIGDVTTPNFVMILINPNSGKINSYIGINREIEVSLTPDISQNEAINIAKNQYPSIDPTVLNATLAIDYPKKGMQKLLWIIRIQGKTIDNMTLGEMVVVDAQTGDVYQITP